MAAAAPAAEAAAEKTEFTVVLKSAGEKKINVIKILLNNIFINFNGGNFFYKIQLSIFKTTNRKAFFL